MNTQALFDSVDSDKNGTIDRQEWLNFWKTVKKSGYTEQEIIEELDNLKKGESWVQFVKES